MTDNEIKKASINLNGAEIKRLAEDALMCLEPFEARDVVAKMRETINRQQAEIERLRPYGTQVEVSKKIESEIKAEAIKEFWQQRPPQLNPNQKGKEQYNKGWNDCISFFAEEYEVFFGVKERDVKEMVGDAE